MKASEQIRAQREFLLANKWVRHAPRDEGEGCAVLRISGGVREEVIAPSYFWQSLDVLFPDRRNSWVGYWNDVESDITLDDVLAVLEYAEKLAVIEESG